MNPKQLRKHLRKKNFRPGAVVRSTNSDIPSLMDQVIPKPASLLEKSSLLGGKREGGASASRSSSSTKKSSPGSKSESLESTFTVACTSSL